MSYSHNKREFEHWAANELLLRSLRRWTVAVTILLVFTALLQLVRLLSREPSSPAEINIVASAPSDALAPVRTELVCLEGAAAFAESSFDQCNRLGESTQERCDWTSGWRIEDTELTSSNAATSLDDFLRSRKDASVAYAVVFAGHDEMRVRSHSKYLESNAELASRRAVSVMHAVRSVTGFSGAPIIPIPLSVPPSMCLAHTKQGVGYERRIPTMVVALSLPASNADRR
jgi:hypothetical protein